MGDQRSNDDANEGGDAQADAKDRHPTIATKVHNSSRDDEEASQADKQEKKKKRKKNEVELDCGVLVTCGHMDVD